MRCETVQKKNFTIKGKFTRPILPTFFDSIWESPIQGSSFCQDTAKIPATSTAMIFMTDKLPFIQILAIGTDLSNQAHRAISKGKMY